MTQSNEIPFTVFMCGCTLADKLNFGYKPKRDEQGFEICPEHSERVKGWRTDDALKKGILSRLPPLA